jgi:hypothetical protein
MNAQVFILRTSNARDRMKAAWTFACRFLELGESAKVVVSECKPTRTLDQNAKLWAMLGDIADQVQWQIDGKLEYLKPEEWKDILTAGLRKHQRVAAGIDGGFVVLGEHTSSMTVGQMSELIELMYAFGAEHSVEWSEPVERAA